MSNARIAKLHNKVFSTPQGSREREQAISALSEADRAAVFSLERDYMAGRITREQIAEMAQKEGGTMTYEQFRQKSDSGEIGIMQELSQFAINSPEAYSKYREKYQVELGERMRLHNRQILDGKCGSTHKNR